MTPRVVFFDLDNTLAQSKQPIESSMADLLSQLLSRTHVAVISGGKFEQLMAQVVSRLPEHTVLTNLHIMPTSGAALYEFRNNFWELEYEERLHDDEVAIIMHAMERGGRETGLIDFSNPLHGSYIENRGSQVSLSALGQEAPVELKKAWDPERTKREALQRVIAPDLAGFDVKVGGLTTIDVTKQGINKAYGVRKLSEHLSIPIFEMLYIGDELGEGGNDSVVLETGIPTHPVNNPLETAVAIKELIFS